MKRDSSSKKQQVTIREVAAKAHVSLSTVSRVMRNPANVPEPTVTKVRAAAKELNYIYNAMAGSLSSRRSNTIGVLLPSSAFWPFGANLMAIQNVCMEKNFSCRVAMQQFSPELERRAMRRFHEQRIGGLILVGLDQSNLSSLYELEESGVPCIMLWETLEEKLNYVAIDNFRAAYNGIRYFIDLNHERIGLLMGSSKCAHRNHERLRGYRQALQDHGMPYDPALVQASLPTLLQGREGIRALLRLNSPPTAVLCATDYLAIGAMRGIHDAGLRVPDDISVCGFDDAELSSYFIPPITTIKTPCYEMGEIATTKLIEALENQVPLDVHYILDTEMLIRSTVARQRSTPAVPMPLQQAQTQKLEGTEPQRKNFPEPAGEYDISPEQAHGK